ncbi:hypothetical protein AMTRI_Chr09g22710 [Amborella trichopoda]
MEMEMEMEMEMKGCVDMLEKLDIDSSKHVLKFLDDPGDLVRLACVSRSWRNFVIENRFCKDLCIKMFPEVCHITRVMECKNGVDPPPIGSSKVLEWENLQREHKIYACFTRELMTLVSDKCCLQFPIGASSTDNYPDESIENTLNPSPREFERPSYWSSQGASNIEAPETLTYKLKSKLCVIHEIDIQPFQAYFQRGSPIYSAKAVRFRLGYSKLSYSLESEDLDDLLPDHKCDDNYVWTYTSPDFPMLQENCLQSFKLPRPVLCIGGMLQIELLGRVQRQEMDALYYVCVCHVRVVGKPLMSRFDVNIPLDYTLMYFPDAKDMISTEERGSDDHASGWQAFISRLREIRAVRGRNYIFNFLLGNGAFQEQYDSDEEEEEILPVIE